MRSNLDWDERGRGFTSMPLTSKTVDLGAARGSMINIPYQENAVAVYIDDRHDYGGVINHYIISI